MKLIKLNIALLFSAVLFTGCDGIAELFDNGITVNIDKTATMTPSNGLVKLSDQESLVEGSDGTLSLRASAEKTFDASVPSDGTPLTVDGTLSLKPKCDMYPKNVEKPVLEVTLDNPMDKTVKEKGTVSVDGKASQEVTVEAAGKSTGKVIIDSGAMSNDMLKSLSSKPDEVTLSGISLATKASDSFSINFWMDIPFVYKKGEVITIDRTFADLGLTGVDVSSLGTSFQIECEVTNSLPFVINSQAESGEKVKANLDTPLAAGTIANPATTKAVITVTSSEVITKISDAVIHLQLTAEEGAKLTKQSKLTIHYKTLKIK